MKNNDQTAITTVKLKRNKHTPQFKEQAKQDGVPQGRQRFRHSSGDALWLASQKPPNWSAL